MTQREKILLSIFLVLFVFILGGWGVSALVTHHNQLSQEIDQYEALISQMVEGWYALPEEEEQETFLQNLTRLETLLLRPDEIDQIAFGRIIQNYWRNHSLDLESFQVLEEGGIKGDFRGHGQILNVLTFLKSLSQNVFYIRVNSIVLDQIRDSLFRLHINVSMVEPYEKN